MRRIQVKATLKPKVGELWKCTFYSSRTSTYIILEKKIYYGSPDYYYKVYNIDSGSTIEVAISNNSNLETWSKLS